MKRVDGWSACIRRAILHGRSAVRDSRALADHSWRAQMKGDGHRFRSRPHPADGRAPSQGSVIRLPVPAKAMPMARCRLLRAMRQASCRKIRRHSPDGIHRHRTPAAAPAAHLRHARPAHAFWLWLRACRRRWTTSASPARHTVMEMRAATSSRRRRGSAKEYVPCAPNAFASDQTRIGLVSHRPVERNDRLLRDSKVVREPRDALRENRDDHRVRTPRAARAPRSRIAVFSMPSSVRLDFVLCAAQGRTTITPL